MSFAQFSQALKPGPFQVAAIVGLAAALGVAPASAAQTDITISMDPPPAAPRINGPRVVGWRPGTPFLYAIAATGASPLAFAATGLPNGLSIDSGSGVISGTVPAAGSYPIGISVTNGAGSADATLTLVAGDTLALTPPMGWNSYDSFYANVKEADVLAAANAMKDVLQPFGWNTVVIDYLWYDPEKIIDANGRWLPSTSKYPNANGAGGFKPLADQIHALGLGFGIHLMRGIPRVAFNQDSPVANASYSAKDAGNSGNVCPWDDHMYGVRGDTAAGQAWYDSIYSQYAGWGVDFVKVDDMMNPYGGNVLHDNEVVAVHDSLLKTGRSIVLSLSPGPNQPGDVQVLNANANMWRTVNDFWDTNGLSTIGDEFTAANNWAQTAGITPGHWPDADMLPLGTVGNRPCAFSHNQQVMVMTLWSMMPSPLIFGGQPTKLAGDAWTTALLTNEEVLAINQDALGSRGKRIAQQGSTEVWARDLSGGRKAVALFNRGTQDATVSASLSALGVSGMVTVRDLWRKQDVSGVTTDISANVPHEGALMYTVAPPGTETGGMGGMGGASGMGGDGAVGGMAGMATGGSPAGGEGGNLAGGGGAAGMGMGGASGAGASSASGGNGAAGLAAGSGAAAGSGNGGQAAGTSDGGASNAGGAIAGAGASSPAGNAGASGARANTVGSDGGCSCRVGSRTRRTPGLLLAYGLLLLSVGARRRKRRRLRHLPGC